MPTTYYEWDPISDNIVAERDENGNVIVEYTTEPGYHGAVISEHRNGQTYYHHHDGQGNLRALTNDQGEVTDTFAYTSNGELTERTGTTPTPFQFGGEYGCFTDQTTGEVMMRQRPLEPEQGRFLSKDPLSEILEALNAYLYAANNPVNFIDPSGLFPEGTCGGAAPFEKFGCDKRFPPEAFFKIVGDKFGERCKAKDMPGIITECMAKGEWEKFLDCIQKKCGVDRGEIVSGMVMWVGLLFCCQEHDKKSGGIDPDPCRCGKPGPKAELPKKCLDPINNKRELGAKCQDCCDFIICLNGVKFWVKMLKDKGKFDPFTVVDLFKEGLKNVECYQKCT